MGPKTLYVSPIGTIAQSSANVDTQLGQVMWNGSDAYRFVKNIAATDIPDKAGCLFVHPVSAGYETFQKHVRVMTEGDAWLLTDAYMMAGMVEGHTFYSSGSTEGDRAWIKIYGKISSCAFSGAVPDTGGMACIPGSNWTGALLEISALTGWAGTNFTGRHAKCLATNGVLTADVFVYCL
jgi:hypothetical protein